MTFSFPEDCAMPLMERVEIVDAEAGVVSLCHGFGQNEDTAKTPENIARWDTAIQVCGRFASTRCVECLAPALLDTIKREVAAAGE